jgi:hypothetical protein
LIKPRTWLACARQANGSPCNVHSQRLLQLPTTNYFKTACQRTYDLAKAKS